jgi:hypothetical protein
VNILLPPHSSIFLPKVSAEPGLFFAAGKRKQQSEAMMDYTKTGDQIVGIAQAVVDEKLDTLESKVDGAIESTVHELRNRRQQIKYLTAGWTTVRSKSPQD